MDTIYKYLLASSDGRLELPEGAVPLHVAAQDDALWSWARVNDEVTVMQERRFIVVGTGRPIPSSDALYVGSGFKEGDNLVWHVFEVTDANEFVESYRQWRRDMGIPVPGEGDES